MFYAILLTSFWHLAGSANALAPDVFLKAKKVIVAMVERDVYMRFVASPFYNQMVRSSLPHGV